MALDLEELAQRLSLLEGADAERAVAGERKTFIDKYGSQFSGDEGIGMAILAEMNRRGIDAAAVGADRVVQEILDAIRQEATALLDKIKVQAQAVGALMDQVQDVQDSVAAAVQPATDLPIEPPPSSVEVPQMDLPPEAPPPAAELPPELPPEAQPAPPPPAATVPSDARVKRPINLAARRRKPATGFKPPASMLDAIRGGR